MTLFGRYELLERLGAGGTAEVLRARLRGEAGFARDVAIKRVHRHLADDVSFITMLMDEAIITSRLRHPNIVSVLDFGSVAGIHFLALEYVDGIDVRSLIAEQCRRGDQLAIEVAVEIAMQV